MRVKLKVLGIASALVTSAVLIILLSFESNHQIQFIIKTVNGDISRNSSYPLLGTFFYPWYSGNGHGYESWSTGFHNPPYNWGSHYIPYLGSPKFDPVHQLYDSDDVTILNEQLVWMKMAGIQFAISSWDTINGTRDRAFSDILNYMENKSNPYPNFKWSLLYEKVGVVNLTTNQVIKDFDYMKSKYISSPSYLKMDGKPVIFIYRDLTKGDEAPAGSLLNNNLNWSMIKDQTGFYIVMRNDIQNKGQDMLKSVNAWYEYKPTIRYEEDNGDSAFVSPGFWKYNNDSPQLMRNITDFEDAVQKLAAAKVHFKLIETWNEWFEGSQIEPGQQIAYDGNLTSYTYLPAALPYGDIYLNILGKYFK